MMAEIGGAARNRDHKSIAAVDETYCRVADNWTYFYWGGGFHRGATDFLLSAKRDGFAAKRFLQKALRSPGMLEHE